MRREDPQTLLMTSNRRDAMAITDYFRPVEAMKAEDVRAFLETHNPGEYNLVDVRQPGEYAEAHIPGALLIPLGELPERLSELDPDKFTITY
jgi:3-mercaptopyruvate sulfurtransferase SseA